MKTVLLIISLLSASVVSGQSAIETKLAGLNNKEAFTIKYDKFEDQTVVFFDDARVNNDKTFEPQFLVLRGLFVFPGAALKGPVAEGVGFSFRSTTREWTFVTLNKLVILADGKRFDLGNADRTSKVNSGTRYSPVTVTENLLYVIPWSDFEAISKASKVELKLGIFEGSFDEKTLALIKSLATLGTK